MRLRVQGLVLIAALSVVATSAQKPQYLDPSLPATERAADLIHRMRLEAVLGFSSELKGEEMQVSEPSFQGSDRTSIDLHNPEEDLLETLRASGKPVVLVLTNGSALAVNWASKNVNSILEAWYPGEEGGTAVAKTSR